VDAAKPSLDMLRSLTDEHVLRALMEHRRLTRAELATRTGISKPTISESVRRLAAAGLVVDTGERTTGRGRVGSYYALAGNAGCALVVSVAPDGVVAEALDAYGDVVAHATEEVGRPARPHQVVRALDAAARRAGEDGAHRFRLAVVSAADPVDRATGHLVHLPDAPFLIGELSPPDVLAGVVNGPVTVDNDVNWAARAERAAAPPLDDFVYLHLGEGLGCAVVNDGVVRRGHAGVVGEIAHVLTPGPDGAAVPFTEVFGALGLRRPGSTAIDVDALRAQVGSTGGAEVLAALARAVCGVLAAVIAFADPELVVVGGTWGPDPAVLDAIGTERRRLPRPVPVRAPRVTDQPALAGAREQALHQLRATITDTSRSRSGANAGHGVPLSTSERTSSASSSSASPMVSGGSRRRTLL
jgi:predicted NBD/HSP70 family sugar kinase